VRVEQAAIVNARATITAPVKILVVMNISSCLGEHPSTMGPAAESNSRTGMVVPDATVKLSVRDVLSAAQRHESARAWEL